MIEAKNKKLIIALAGSPNSGKTSIFNNLTGAMQHVGNYPGVTVEQKTGQRKYKGYSIKVFDLPGTYSLTAYTLEELVARNYIINEKPDVVVNIVDSSNLSRNLYLSTQLIELDIPLVFAFNMSDVFKKSGMEINLNLLSQLLGAPIVQTVGSKGTGMSELLDKVLEVHENPQARKRVNLKYGDELENEVSKIIEILKKAQAKLSQKFDLRWLAIKLLEQDREVLKSLKVLLEEKTYTGLVKVVENSINHIKNVSRDMPETIIAESRYGFINGALKETLTEKPQKEVSASDRIDRVLINRVWGLPIFAIIMWLMFQLVFKVGDYPMNWLALGFSRLSQLLSSALPAGLLKSLLIDGIIGGVGGILVFTPKIMLLFISIALLEDSGYMARVAFIMDRIMHKIGLHGKSFIPMLIGFGCTIPAYMCTRTLESKNDRMITMHISTFMSCGGRLPIYILFAGIFFPKNAGNIIFSIYIIGIVIAVLMAKLLRATKFKGEAEPFVMELPTYRVPTVKGVLIHMWERTLQYLKKAGTIILAISIIMWILFTFPRIGNAYSEGYSKQLAGLEQSFNLGDISEKEYKDSVQGIEGKMAAERLAYSAAGKIGRFVEPVFKPLGFDWRLSLASISGMAGKEVVVSTMGTLFSLTNENKDSQSLRSAIAGQYNPLVGYNFMLFSLLYFPCIASLAVFKKEAGTKELLFQIGYTLGLAWVVSFIVFQVGRLFI